MYLSKNERIIHEHGTGVLFDLMCWFDENFRRALDSASII